MNKVRFGMIGVGNMGTSHCGWLVNNRIEGACLSAVCDIDEGRRNWAKENLPADVKIYDNYLDLLDSGEVDALLEVKAGGADACVLDFVLAGAMVGQGDYSDLMVIPDLELSVEEYGIGFRQGSDLTAAVNQAMQELIDDGTLNELAVKYELADLLLANQ